MQDYGVVSNSIMMDMVRVLDFALEEGKVAIHCHAGLGRTGLLIACYLVYALRMTHNQAIFYIRDKRFFFSIFVNFFTFFKII
jgi:protein tyrosine phosphatase domain-containing protein 1